MINSLCCHKNFIVSFRRKRQEFIVTLDGYEDNKTAKKPDDKQQHKQQKRRKTSDRTRHHRQDKNSSFTQSDEEFLEHVDRNSPPVVEKSRHSSSRRRTRSSKSHKHSKHAEEKFEALSQVDKEIMLAEKKLKAQKLLKKSLEQVQNLNTNNFAMPSDNTMNNKIKSTTFVNPHFKPKLDIPVVNVVPFNVAGQPIAPSVQTLQPLSPPAIYPGTVQLPSYVEMVSPQSQKKTPPQVNIVKPVLSVSENLMRTTAPTTTPTLTPISTAMSGLNIMFFSHFYFFSYAKLLNRIVRKKSCHCHMKSL